MPFLVKKMNKYHIIIAIILLSSCSLQKKYQEHKYEFEEEIKQLELKKDYADKSEYLLFIGSSSIRLWSSVSEDIEPYKSVIRGYGGAHYYDLIHFIDRLTKNHEKAKAVVLFVANDITGNKEGQKLELKPKEVKKLFIGVYKRIRKQLGKDIPIFKIETTPTPKRWEVWPKISKANNLIKAYTENRKNIYFISTRDYYLNDNGKPIKEYFVEDQLHLNIKGYKLWGEIIKKEIEKYVNYSNHKLSVTK